MMIVAYICFYISICCRIEAKDRYQSPEEIRFGQNCGITTRTNIYTLGLIMFQLLNKSVPKLKRNKKGGRHFGFNRSLTSSFTTKEKIAWPKIRKLLKEMVSLNPASRPTLSAIQSTLLNDTDGY
jgi:serine/threonine protein kinase